MKGEPASDGSDAGVRSGNTLEDGIMLDELLVGGLLLAVTAAVALVGWSVYRDVRRQEAGAAADERRDEEWHRCVVRRCRLECDRMQAELDRANGPVTSACGT